MTWRISPPFPGLWTDRRISGPPRWRSAVFDYIPFQNGDLDVFDIRKWLEGTSSP
jgi:hypothetical protein